MKYGLQEIAQEIGAYTFGDAKVPSIPYQDDADWSEFFTRFENQSIPGFETYNCTGFATTTQIEILEKRLYGVEQNYSDRWVGIISGTKHRFGNDPQVVYEAIRKYGLIPEKMLPFSGDIDTPEEYFSFKGADKEACYAEGKKWLALYEFYHDWLWTNRPENYRQILKEAQKTCPIALQVTAWHEDDNGMYVDNGMNNNHWTLGVRYNTEEEVFDTYKDGGNNLKTLDPTHNIGRAKRIWINKKTLSALKKQKSWLEIILEHLMINRSFLQVCEANLGKDASPNDLVPDEVGCAETVTTLLRQVYTGIPILTGTYSLYDFLRNPKNGFVAVTEPSPETIIICATGTGNGTMNGHVGVFMDNNLIASNDSNTGKFMKNYDLASWTKRYVAHGGFKIYLYKHV